MNINSRVLASLPAYRLLTDTAGCCTILVSDANTSGRKFAEAHVVSFRSCEPIHHWFTQAQGDSWFPTVAADSSPFL